MGVLGNRIKNTEKRKNFMCFKYTSAIFPNKAYKVPSSCQHQDNFHWYTLKVIPLTDLSIELAPTWCGVCWDMILNVGKTLRSTDWTQGLLGLLGINGDSDQLSTAMTIQNITLFHTIRCFFHSNPPSGSHIRSAPSCRDTQNHTNQSAHYRVCCCRWLSCLNVFWQ